MTLFEADGVTLADLDFEVETVRLGCDESDARRNRRRPLARFDAGVTLSAATRSQRADRPEIEV